MGVIGVGERIIPSEDTESFLKSLLPMDIQVAPGDWGVRDGGLSLRSGSFSLTPYDARRFRYSGGGISMWRLCYYRSINAELFRRVIENKLKEKELEWE